MSKQDSTGTEKRSKNSEVSKLLYISAALFLLICMAPVATHIFSLPELYSSTIGAVIGVALSAIITCVLLHGQSRQDIETNKTQLENQSRKELEVDRNSRIYKEKLKLYRDFMESLNRIVSNGKFSEKESIDLQFAVARIAMHSDKETVDEVSRQMELILNTIGGVSDEPDEESGICIMKSLMSLVRLFKIELYAQEVGQETDINEMTKTFQHISSAATREDDNIQFARIRAQIKDMFNSPTEGMIKGTGMTYNVTQLITRRTVSPRERVSVAFSYSRVFGFYFRVNAQLEDETATTRLLSMLHKQYMGQKIIAPKDTSAVGGATKPTQYSQWRKADGQTSYWFSPIPQEMTKLLLKPDMEEAEKEQLRQYLHRRFGDICDLIRQVGDMLNLKRETYEILKRKNLHQKEDYTIFIDDNNVLELKKNGWIISVETAEDSTANAPGMNIYISHSNSDCLVDTLLSWGEETDSGYIEKAPWKDGVPRMFYCYKIGAKHKEVLDFMENGINDFISLSRG